MIEAVDIPQSEVIRVGFRRYKVSAWQGEVTITEFHRCSRYTAECRGMTLLWWIGSTGVIPPFRHYRWPAEGPA